MCKAMVPWYVWHARENPGHRVSARAGHPGRCETCGAESPLAGLRTFSPRPPETASERVIAILREALGAGVVHLPSRSWPS